MPVKLIGPKVNYFGKSLWEILGNLKNFGVGRLVYKSHFLNYKETSYYKIVKVQPVMASSKEHMPRCVMVWAEHVFRGTKYPELIKMHQQTFEPRFHLVPKKDEAKYLNAALKPRVREIPDTMEWPPLMKVLLEREAARRGEEGIPKLSTKLHTGTNTIAVVSKEKPVMKLTESSLYSQLSVSQLTGKLDALKMKGEKDAS